jgi:hypothetical protein
LTTPTTLNIDNAPRDLEGLMNTQPMQRYRFALAVEAIPNNNDAITGFVAKPVPEQAGMILAKLHEIDARRAAGQAAPLPSNGAAAPVARQPDPVHAPPPQQLGGQPMPQQMGAPPPQQLGHVPPPAAYGAPPNGAAPGLPPGYMPPAGAMAPQQVGTPMAAPPPMPPQAPVQQILPMQPHPQQQPVRTPATATDPGASAALAATGGIAAQALSSIISKLDALAQTVEDDVPGLGNIQEVLEAVLGVAATQQVLAVMVLLLLEQTSGLPRAVICQSIREEIAKDPISPLIAGLRGSEGKG